MRELSLHILDALENSLEAGATFIELTIEENSAADLLTITIADNGRGMSEEQLARAADPFFTTRQTRHVGLGIPLFKAAAERCAGGLTLRSQLGKGTTLRATFRHSHIDRAPLGDIEGTLLAVISSDSPCDVQYTHRVNGHTFAFSTVDMRLALEGLPLSNPMVRKWIQEFIIEGEEELGELQPTPLL
jgi:hypothetical protein